MDKFGPILWLIIIGALFYFMMRSGGCCGGGHGGHEHGKESDTEDLKKEKSEHKHGGC